MRKIFDHEYYNFEDLNTTNIKGKRHYVLPSGIAVPSVTTVLGEKLDDGSLERWRARVGAAEADKISHQAATRGTAIHEICEAYLRNETNYPKGTMPIHIDTFKTLRPIFDERIGKIFAIEAPLYSEKLYTAGRTDCIAEFDGIMSIIDFKTSKKVKKEEWIESYFLQATCYSLMAEELTNLIIPQIAILIAVDNESAQVFVKDKKQYVDKVREIFRPN